MAKIKKQKIRLNIAPSPELLNYLAANVPDKRGLEFSRDRLEIMLDTTNQNTANDVRQMILDKMVEVTDEGWEDDTTDELATPNPDKEKTLSEKSDEVKTKGQRVRASQMNK